MSSIIFPTLGNSSLTSMPLLPYFWNLKGEGKAAPVFLSVGKLAIGSGLPAYFLSAGFGSNVSTCEGPPFMKRWITCFALAGNCGALGRSGLLPAPAGRLRKGRQAAELPEGKTGQPQAAAGEEIAARHDRQLQSRVGGVGHLRFSSGKVGQISNLPEEAGWKPAPQVNQQMRTR